MVGAEQVERAFFPDAEQMQPARDQPPQTILVAAHQQVDRKAHRRVLPAVQGEGVHVALGSQVVHERPQMEAAAGVDEVDLLRRAQDVVGVAFVDVVGGEELAEQGAGDDEEGDDCGPHHRQPVRLELAPHQPPLRRDVVGLLFVACARHHGRYRVSSSRTTVRRRRPPPPSSSRAPPRPRCCPG